MISRWWTTLACRFAGVRCSLKRPSSKDLIKEMNDLGRKVEVKTFELKRQREDLNRTFGGRPR